MYATHVGSWQDTLERARLYVSAINRSLRGIPPERVRLHTCYGINEGPRVHDAPLAEYVDTLFTIRAGAFSFEAANPRHEHVYHVFESVKPPRDAVLLPGVISHATSIVEHPDTIADRIVRFAARRPGERGGQRRLRLLLPGHVPAGDPPADRLGQVRVAGRGRPPGHRPALALAGWG